MTHQFDVDLAAKYGTDEAIFTQYVYFWTLKNRANKKHEHDDRTWTYNSQQALAELFPYWTRRVIQRVVKSCIDKGLIVTGNYNNEGRDRTTWYALGDAAELYYFPLTQTVQCNAPNGADQCTERVNVYNEQLYELQLAAADKENKQLKPREVMEQYNVICTKLHPCIRMTDKRAKAIRALYNKGFTDQQLLDAFRLAQGSKLCTGGGSRGWKADFDWLTKEDNLVKVLEGKYTDAAAPAQQDGRVYEIW